MHVHQSVHDGNAAGEVIIADTATSPAFVCRVANGVFVEGIGTPWTIGRLMMP
jgi:hypothetical protein